MVLWGKFTSDVSEAMQVRDEHSTVLVLRFAKIKVWKGKIHSFIIIYLCFKWYPNWHVEISNRRKKCEQCLQCQWNWVESSDDWSWEVHCKVFYIDSWVESSECLCDLLSTLYIQLYHIAVFIYFSGFCFNRQNNRVKIVHSNLISRQRLSFQSTIFLLIVNLSAI